MYKIKHLHFVQNSAEMVGWYAGFDPPSPHGSTGAISTAQVELPLGDSVVNKALAETFAPMKERKMSAPSFEKVTRYKDEYQAMFFLTPS